MEYASPIEAESLKEFPPSYIEVAEFDCLRDEGIQFGNRLREENVQVELHEVRQACHDFETVTDSALCREAIDRRVRFLKSKSD